MRRLRPRVQDTLEFYNGPDLMDSLELTVFDVPSIFDDASASAIREHFKQWAATAPQHEQGTGPSLSQRYRYCIQVDNEALESVILYDPATSPPGYVNLLWKDWEPTPDPREPVEEPTEGCTQIDVGWMMVDYKDVMVAMYRLLRDWNDWDLEYRRHPEVAHA